MLPINEPTAPARAVACATCGTLHHLEGRTYLVLSQATWEGKDTDNSYNVRRGFGNCDQRDLLQDIRLSNRAVFCRNAECARPLLDHLFVDDAIYDDIIARAEAQAEAQRGVKTEFAAPVIRPGTLSPLFDNDAEMPGQPGSIKLHEPPKAEDYILPDTNAVDEGT